jgi:hypothetical protein
MGLPFLLPPGRTEHDPVLVFVQVLDCLGLLESFRVRLQQGLVLETRSACMQTPPHGTGVRRRYGVKRRKHIQTGNTRHNQGVQVGEPRKVVARRVGGKHATSSSARSRSSPTCTMQVGEGKGSSRLRIGGRCRRCLAVFFGGLLFLFSLEAEGGCVVQLFIIHNVRSQSIGVSILAMSVSVHPSLVRPNARHSVS